MNRIPKGNQVLLTIFYILSFLLGIGLRLTVNYINTGKRIEWNGGVYHGQLVDGIPEGEGVFKRNGVTYEGTWTKGTYFTGKVTSYKYVYEGEVMNFKFHGYGACKYVDGRRYWGYWKEDMKHGLGRYLDSSGKISFGQFCNGLLKASNDHNFTVGQSVCGIDVSHHQGIINWQDLYFDANNNGSVEIHKGTSSTYMQPVFFAFAKSTEGSTIQDDRFEQNHTEARKCGIIFGAYHFFSMNTSAKSQAENFIKNTTLQPGDFPPVLDLEKVEYRRNISNEEFRPTVESAKEWLKIIGKEYGVRPIIYTTINIYQDFIAKDNEFNKYKLWIANPGTKQPRIPNMIMWQFSHEWKMNGIDSNVDANYFVGDYTKLCSFIRENGIR